ncbi:MAG: class I SAM-dependent methyltransferase [Patescibacteria group bacterium UBA2163]
MFLQPADIVKNMPLYAGMRIADFGCGCGNVSFLLADKLDESSTLYSFDIHPEQIATLTQERDRRAIEYMFPMRADLNTHIPLRDDILDAGLVSNTLHALHDRDQFLRELIRTLVPGGTVLFVDWLHSFKNMGPPENMVIDPITASTLFSNNGFVLGATIPAGTHHYGFLAKKPYL